MIELNTSKDKGQLLRWDAFLIVLHLSTRTYEKPLRATFLRS